MAKLNPFLRPIYLLIAKLKKLGEETFRETNSQKVTRISLFKKKGTILVAPSVCTRKEKRRGWQGREKNMGKEKKPFFV